MDLIITVILIIGVWYLLRMLLAVNRVRRNARDFFNQFNQTASGAARPQEREAGWSAPVARKRKKIDPNVGEYVAYEEVTTRASDATDARTGAAGSGRRDYGAREPQVTDAEWEDIPR